MAATARRRGRLRHGGNLSHERCLRSYSVRRIQFVYDVHSSSRSGITKTFGQTRALDDVDLAHRDRHHLRAARPQRRRQDHAGPDPGHAGPTRRGHRRCRRARPPRRPDGVRRSIGLTGQYAAVDDVLTGEENLRDDGAAAHAPGRGARAAPPSCSRSSTSSTPPDRRAGTYSGGMKRRLDLAVSMIERPTLLFLDEPTTGLDPRSREQVWATVRQLEDEGVTILLTTQYLEEADRLADLGRRARRRPHRRRGHRRGAEVDGRRREPAAAATLARRRARCEASADRRRHRGASAGRAGPSVLAAWRRRHLAPDVSTRSARRSTTSSCPSPTAAAVAA